MVQTRSSRRQNRSEIKSSGKERKTSTSHPNAAASRKRKAETQPKAKSQSKRTRRGRSEDHETQKRKSTHGRRGKERQQSLEEVRPHERNTKNGEGTKMEQEDEEVKGQERFHTEEEGKGEKGVKVEMDSKGEGENVQHQAEQTASGIEIDSEQMEREIKSTILEKGLIYFFFRPRVNTKDTDVDSLDDVQRTYIVMLPLPTGTRLTPTAVKPKDASYRLLILPKKRLPSTNRHERFLVFVEKPNITLEELKETFLVEKSYSTKTRGERIIPPPRPIGEAVYALMRREKDRSSHFAYILTNPDKPNDIQRAFGLRERGSYVISVRNPKTPPPRGMPVAKPPEFPKEIMEEFRGRRWIPAEPKHFQFEHAQILFIGERGEILEEVSKEVLEDLGDEDMERTKALKGNDPVFHDLELDKGEIPSIMGTWPKEEQEEDSQVKREDKTE